MSSSSPTGPHGVKNDSEQASSCGQAWSASVAETGKSISPEEGLLGQNGPPSGACPPPRPTCTSAPRCSDQDGRCTAQDSNKDSGGGNARKNSSACTPALRISITTAAPVFPPPPEEAISEPPSRHGQQLRQGWSETQTTPALHLLWGRLRQHNRKHYCHAFYKLPEG